MSRIWKQLLLPLIVMYVATIGSLFLLSLFSYWWKWQADTIMVGIIGTYILSGVVGGIFLYFLRVDKEVQHLYSKGMILGSAYMLILLVLSAICGLAGGWDVLLIAVLWLLVVASTLLGSFVSHAIWKKR